MGGKMAKIGWCGKFERIWMGGCNYLREWDRLLPKRRRAGIGQPRPGGGGLGFAQWKAVEEVGGHTGTVQRVAVNAEGMWIVSISWDGTVRLWGIVKEGGG